MINKHLTLDVDKRLKMTIQTIRCATGVFVRGGGVDNFVFE